MPTPPTTRSGHAIHERILLYGGGDAGKTSALLTIAKWHQKRGSDAVFYVLCNDMAYERMLIPSGRFGELENVDFRNVRTMDEYISEARAIQKKVRSQDWFTIDLLNGGWEAAQDEYAVRVYGEDLDDYWLTQKERSKGKDDSYPVSGWEWGPINKRYRALANDLLLRLPCHVLCISGETALKESSKSSGSGGESREITDLFGRIGRKPMGQKDDPHRFHTIIHMGKTSRKWVMDSAKDRERDRMEGVEVTDFYLNYLVKIAGWKP